MSEPSPKVIGAFLVAHPNFGAGPVNTLVQKARETAHAAELLRIQLHHTTPVPLVTADDLAYTISTMLSTMRSAVRILEMLEERALPTGGVPS